MALFVEKDSKRWQVAPEEITQLLAVLTDGDEVHRQLVAHRSADKLQAL